MDTKKVVSDFIDLNLGEYKEIALQIHAHPEVSNYEFFSSKILADKLQTEGFKVTCDVALIPVGGKFTMDRKQAADFVVDIKPKAAIPTHYGDVVGNPGDGEEFKCLVEKQDNSIQVELRL